MKRNNNTVLDEFLCDICGEDFTDPSKRRIVSLNKVKDTYLPVWIRLYNLSLKIVFDSKIRIGLSSKQLNSLQKKRDHQMLSNAGTDSPLLSAGDIEVSGRNKNIKSFNKALHFIQKQLLLNIYDPDEQGKRNIEKMVKSALRYILEADNYNDMMLEERLFNRAMADYIESHRFIDFCNHLVQYDKSLLHLSGNQGFNSEKVFYSFLLIKESNKELSLGMINSMIFGEDADDFLYPVDRVSVIEQFSKHYFSKEIGQLFNGFRSILYTLLVGMICCLTKGSIRKEIISDFIAYFGEIPVVENDTYLKRKHVIIKSPVPVDVYLDEILPENHICSIDPSAKTITSFDFNAPGKETKLLIVASGFSKTINFIGRSTSFDISDFLSEKELSSCFRRKEAVKHLNDSTFKDNCLKDIYDLKQLSYTGTEDDLSLISQYLTKAYENGSLQTAMHAVMCMITLSIKYRNTSYASLIQKQIEYCSPDYFLYTVVQEAYEKYQKFLDKKKKMVRVDLTIITPININVYLNSNDNLILSIDRNKPTSRYTCRIQISEDPDDNKLLISARSFDKILNLKGKEGENILIDLSNYLSKQEIIANYDIEDVYKYRNRLTFYSMEQLAQIGSLEDIPVVISNIDSIQAKQNNARMAKLFECLCTMTIRLNAEHYSTYIVDLYKDYFLGKKNAIIDEAWKEFAFKMKIS